MRVTIDIEQGVWMRALMRAQEEGLKVDEVVTAWLKRAVRQKGTVLPTERPESTVVEMGERRR